MTRQQKQNRPARQMLGGSKGLGNLPVSQQEFYTTNYMRGIYNQIPLYPFCFANLVVMRVRRAVFELATRQKNPQ